MAQIKSIPVDQRGGVYIDEDGNVLTVKRSFANVAAGGTTTLLAAVAAKKLRILSLSMTCGGTATSLTFNTKPAGSAVAITPAFLNGINGVNVLPYNKDGWFQTAAGDDLTVTAGAGATTAVIFTYVEVP